MSHYSILVIHKEYQSVDALMEPYKETETNPISKWDWWEEGGRFEKALVAKNSVTGKEKYITSGKISDVIFLEDEIDHEDFYTFAVITPDGLWHAPGNMLWFGMTDANKEAIDEWKRNYRRDFIEKYNDGYYCTIVDAHI